MEKCYFCESHCKELPKLGAANGYECNNCGKYQISYAYLAEFENKLNNVYKDKKDLISTWLRGVNTEEEPYKFRSGGLEKILNEISTS